MYKKVYDYLLDLCTWLEQQATITTTKAVSFEYFYCARKINEILDILKCLEDSEVICKFENSCSTLEGC